MIEVIVFLIILYGIPISLGIWLIYYLFREYNSKRVAKIVRNSLIGALLLIIVGLCVWDWHSRRFHLDIQLNKNVELKENIQLTVTLIEIDSFLDSPVQFDMEFYDPNTKKSSYFEINSGFGPTFYLGYKENNPDVYFMTGYEENYHEQYRLDLSSGKITSTRTIDTNLVTIGKFNWGYTFEYLGTTDTVTYQP